MVDRYSTVNRPLIDRYTSNPLKHWIFWVSGTVLSVKFTPPDTPLSKRHVSTLPHVYGTLGGGGSTAGAQCHAGDLSAVLKRSDAVTRAMQTARAADRHVETHT